VQFLCHLARSATGDHFQPDLMLLRRKNAFEAVAPHTGRRCCRVMLPRLVLGLE